MGESDRSSASKALTGKLSNTYDQINSANVSANNRFDNYKSPFGYNEMKTNLDDLFNQQTNLLKQNTASERASASRDAAGRMASQGITGGSLLNNQVNAVNNNYNKNLSSALAQLGIAKAGQNSSLMQYENSNDFRNTGAAQNVDMQNISNMLQKYGLLNNNLGVQSNNIGNLDDSTWLDDVLAVANTAGSVYKNIAGGAAV